MNYKFENIVIEEVDSKYTFSFEVAEYDFFYEFIAKVPFLKTLFKAPRKYIKGQIGNWTVNGGGAEIPQNFWLNKWAQNKIDLIEYAKTKSQQ